jgi:hypothetical protein
MTGITTRTAKGSPLAYSELDNNWSYILPEVSAKSANYTVVAADEGNIIDVDTTSGDVTISLTAAATLGDGYTLYVRKNDASANTVIIDPDGSETVNGSSTKSLTAQYQSLKLICDGSNWLTCEDLSSGYALIGSPAFTGVPTAPTASDGDNSTQIATTEFVNNAVQIVGTSTNTTLLITATASINMTISRNTSIRIQVDGTTYGEEVVVSTGNDDGQTHSLTSIAVVSGLTAGTRTIALQHLASGSACTTYTGSIGIVAIG